MSTGSDYPAVTPGTRHVSKRTQLTGQQYQWVDLSAAHASRCFSYCVFSFLPFFSHLARFYSWCIRSCWGMNGGFQWRHNFNWETTWSAGIDKWAYSVKDWKILQTAVTYDRENIFCVFAVQVFTACTLLQLSTGEDVAWLHCILALDGKCELVIKLDFSFLCSTFFETHFMVLNAKKKKKRKSKAFVFIIIFVTHLHHVFSLLKLKPN